MTTQKTIKKHKKDLSHIDNLAELLEEKRMVKARVKLHEDALGEHWKKLPGESFKFVVRKVVPFYLNNKVLDKSWGLVSGAFGLLSSTGRSETQKNMVGTAKKLGVFTAVRAVYNLWRNKK